jgi:putative heme-binding domain-containing protein
MRSGLDLNKALHDADPSVVRLAILIAAERRRKDLKPDIEAAIKKHSADRDVFRTGIAALELIDKDASAKPSGSLDGLLLKIITDAAQPAAIRALAMLYLNNRDGAARTLLELVKDNNAAVAAAAARTLGSVMKPEVTTSLRELALNAHAPLTVRLEAMGSLAGRADAELLPLLPLLKAAEPGLARQAVRTLRGAIGNAEVRAAFEQSFESLPSLGPFLALAFGKPSPEIRPATDEQWHEAIRSGKGDADEGRRVFFSAASLCATCHIAEGRGVRVGPDLSTIGRATNREKLIDSILTPSREIGPLYVMKTVQLKDGTTVGGIQSDKESGGRVDIYVPGGRMEQIPHNKVAKIDISPVSLMPEALELNLTVQEFRDLIAYLETLR